MAEGERETWSVTQQRRLLRVELGEEGSESGGDLGGLGAIEHDLPYPYIQTIRDAPSAPEPGASTVRNPAIDNRKPKGGEAPCDHAGG